MSLSTRLGVNRCRKLILNPILYHPITKERLCRFSCLDVCSTFRSIAKYQDLRLGHLLFRYSDFMMMEIVEARLRRATPAEEFYILWFINIKIKVITTIERSFSSTLISLALSELHGLIFWSLLSYVSLSEEACMAKLCLLWLGAYHTFLTTNSHKIQAKLCFLFTWLIILTEKLIFIEILYLFVLGIRQDCHHKFFSTSSS